MSVGQMKYKRSLIRRMLSLFLITVAAALIQGCKIKIDVPAGSTVVSDSGRFSCRGPGSCIVNVNDLFFDETFSVETGLESKFIGWKKRDRGLCGGSSKPCRLFTSGFEGVPELLAFLESDEVFFLEPEVESIQNDYVPDTVYVAGTFSIGTLKLESLEYTELYSAYDVVLDGDRDAFPGNSLWRPQILVRNGILLVYDDDELFGTRIGEKKFVSWGRTGLGRPNDIFFRDSQIVAIFGNQLWSIDLNTGLVDQNLLVFDISYQGSRIFLTNLFYSKTMDAVYGFNSNALGKGALYRFDLNSGKANSRVVLSESMDGYAQCSALGSYMYCLNNGLFGRVNLQTGLVEKRLGFAEGIDQFGDLAE